MIVIDSSALVAILLQEPEARRFRDMLALSRKLAISAATWIELHAVILSRLPATGQAEIDVLFGAVRPKISIKPVTTKQARIAVEAWKAYGKGRHRAALNMGDCFSYALAQDLRAPLMFKGGDFSKTDVRTLALH